MSPVPLAPPVPAPVPGMVVPPVPPAAYVAAPVLAASGLPNENVLIFNYILGFSSIFTVFVSCKFMCRSSEMIKFSTFFVFH